MSVPGPDHDSLLCFAYEEARLIDDKRFDEWYDLFADDGIYWMPLTRGQVDGINHTSLFHEDKLLLRIRIERLKNPRSFSQHPPSHCQHVLQRPCIETGDEAAGAYVLRTPFLYLETQADAQLVLAGVSWLHLRSVEGRLKIRLKKVELVNCDAALPSIELFP
ncbi:MAG TPA: aromatic-ring-hydroxylating dioxygenase subunit beta [Steroidobacteraceae bacterium]|nr:aromatic-ring-hydroxylating dioxygenase subunit beta [Steroidobacteraceae bacterium]